MKDSKKCVAVVLAAGKGKRMKSDTLKQYLLLKGRPLLYYCLKTFQDSFVDEIVLVTGSEEIEYCRKEIVEKYGFFKVTAIVPGGKERYHSVAAGLMAVDSADYVFIHDGARPFVTLEILDKLFEDVCEFGSAICAVRVKDTIKIADDQGFAITTPNRHSLWQMQTPQTFDFAIIRDAYEKLIASEVRILSQGIDVTDDAMVLETFTNRKIRLTEGDYHNIKMTTPEDLEIGEVFLKDDGCFENNRQIF